MPVGIVAGGFGKVSCSSCAALENPFAAQSSFIKKCFNTTYIM
jgi:hypothetical protein